MNHESAEQRIVPTGQAAKTLGASPSTNGGGRGTTPFPRLTPVSGLTLDERMAALRARCPANTLGLASCNLPAWITIFFDGTGNNQKADLATLEHSNVVRMYRAHRQDKTEGIFAHYAPGIGTPFPEIGDNGFGPIPVVSWLADLTEADLNMGTGRLGQKRLDWAFEQVQKSIDARLEGCKTVTKVTLSVFGFSRGAALARAFLQQLTHPKSHWCNVAGSSLTWKNGNVPIEVNFVGLWDTVASVGVPMSSGSFLAERSSRRQSWWGDFVGGYTNRLMDPRYQHPLFALPLYQVGNALKTTFGAGTPLTVKDLAFGTGSADPAPGVLEGHESWGGQMALEGGFHKKCVHIIAAHEQRASFPVDSVLKGKIAPDRTVEMVFPGVHSDVGGGYRPGEQNRGGQPAPAGKKNVLQDGLKLSQLTLHAMYREAAAAGVPLLPMGQKDAWEQRNDDDFILNPGLLDVFNRYQSEVKAEGLPLGDAMLAHTKMLFRWRFSSIRRERQTYGDQNPQGRAADRAKMTDNEMIYLGDELDIESELKAKLDRRMTLMREAVNMGTASAGALSSKQRAAKDAREEALDAELKQLDIDILTLQARKSSLPSHDGSFIKAMRKFDAELMEDASQLSTAIRLRPEERSKLRKHYLQLLEAYEDEFIHNKGLRDEKILAFFDNHVHDSLAAFDRDATLPSDPRVVFVGTHSKA
jgi:hypothetical protein